jgi:hypothetical protein
MRAFKHVPDVYDCEASPDANVAIYDFYTRSERIRRERRMSDLYYENKLLRRVVCETEAELARLRSRLANS